MIKQLSIRFLSVASPLVFCVIACVIAGGQSPNSRKLVASTNILALIEKYKAPPHPKSMYIDRETYDYRIASHRSVPPTLTDVFVCDVWQRVTMDLKLTIIPEQVSEEIVVRAIGVYLEKDAQDIAGYRPWTHWNFVHRLKQPQREALASELTAYIKKNGVRDREDR